MKKLKLDEMTVDSSRFTNSQFMNIISNLSTFGRPSFKPDVSI